MLKTKIVVICYIVFFTTTIIHAEKKVVIDENQIVVTMKKGLSEVKKLLKHVSIYKLFANNKTLLHYAVESGDYKIVSYLVGKNSFLAQKGGKLYGTPLHDAIYYGHSRIALFLINKGTPLNERDVQGNTPLHLAAERGNLTLIQKLVQNGASIHIVNNNRQTPYNLIPNLTWDNEKDIEQLLYPKKKKQSKLKERKPVENSSINYSIDSYTLKKNKNRTKTRIDKGSHVENAQIGIHIQTDKKSFR